MWSDGWSQGRTRCRRRPAQRRLRGGGPQVNDGCVPLAILTAVSRLKLCYITSAGHSGSTLLDVLISSHSRVVSVGEVMRLEFAPRKKCSCAVKFILHCPFWNAVNASMIEREGFGLADVQLQSDDPAIFAHHNAALFEAVSHVSGREVIVDSSKNVPRLQMLLECGRFDVLPIHLIRRPQGVVYSHMRKGRPWVNRRGRSQRCITPGHWMTVRSSTAQPEGLRSPTSLARTS